MPRLEDTGVLAAPEGDEARALAELAGATASGVTPPAGPPIAQERVTQGPDGLVRIALKKRFADGTFAVDLDPLSRASSVRASFPRLSKRSPPRRRVKRRSLDGQAVGIGRGPSG